MALLPRALRYYVQTGSQGEAAVLRLERKRIGVKTLSNIVPAQLGFGRTLVLGRCAWDAWRSAQITTPAMRRAGLHRRATGFYARGESTL